jgi:hypothetical protein
MFFDTLLLVRSPWAFPRALRQAQGPAAGSVGCGSLVRSPWAFPRGKAAGSVLRRARPDGLGSAPPALRPAKMLESSPGLCWGLTVEGRYCWGSLPFTPHTLSALTQDKSRTSLAFISGELRRRGPPLCQPGAAHPTHLGGVPSASGAIKKHYSTLNYSTLNSNLSLLIAFADNICGKMYD